MAKTCLRSAATQIQQLLDGSQTLKTPDGKTITGVETPVLKAKQARIQLILKLDDGTKRVILAGERLKSGDGWVVGYPIHIASYQCPMSGQEFHIVAQPKAYLPDQFLSEEDITGKKKGMKRPTLPISGDFNGGIHVTNRAGEKIHVHGWSCRNHPPQGYRLYSSWGSIPGSSPLLMEFAVSREDGENTRDISPKKRKIAA